MNPRTEGPSLPYAEVISALVGPQHLNAWIQLAEILDPRPHWRFTINPDAMALWQHDTRHLWATAGRRALVLWHGGRHPDDAAWWQFHDPAPFVDELARLEAGRPRYRTRTGGTRRWHLENHPAAEIAG